MIVRPGEFCAADPEKSRLAAAHFQCGYEDVIQRISAPETHVLRLPILRAGMPAKAAIFPGDDDPLTVHLGAFEGSQLVGVASILKAAFPGREEISEAWQLRGMATLPEVRGRGYGRALAEACIEQARQCGGGILWCNARSPAVGFYARLGFETVGSEFAIPTAGPHFRMLMALT